MFARIRHDARVEGLSVRELARRHGVHRRTVRAALESAEPPFDGRVSIIRSQFLGRSTIYKQNSFHAAHILPCGTGRGGDY